MKMLKYCKIILEKVSFDEFLFKKEYYKAIKYLNSNERIELRVWLRKNEMIKALPINPS